VNGIKGKRGKLRERTILRIIFFPGEDENSTRLDKTKDFFKNISMQIRNIFKQN
jgi:hypothetical protein